MPEKKKNANKKSIHTSVHLKLHTSIKFYEQSGFNFKVFWQYFEWKKSNTRENLSNPAADILTYGSNDPLNYIQNDSFESLNIKEKKYDSKGCFYIPNPNFSHMQTLTIYKNIIHVIFGTLK